ncbi:uncharacterized protein LOC107044573 isoform X2 [Diachasma alloeum]|uniref:uncharacterized protein LOC107044573 isoform X2 n=1 Tax=Diachasma alloeum TaxID=454923 RepID=UPI00073816D9|nr:uncharacterized protein LOC107044573 isoform X2 [Diachasma alloeum]
MGNPSNYRVKVNLSQFYEDVRKLSYVYVNEKNISHILHLHERIKQVFGITRPFYLTSCEGVYLPMNEDVRIIQGEETIRVCLGTVNPNCLTIWREIGVKCNGKPLPTIEVPRQLEKKNQQANSPEKILMVTDSDACDSKSVKNVTESEGQGHTSLAEDSDTDTTQDPKKTPQNPSQTPELYSIPQKKRRRVRKRKSKISPELPVVPQQLPPPSKPISIPFNSSFTPKTKPKHFKFNWDENEDEKDTKIETRRNGVSTPIIPELNTLLSLKNCQFPVTFVGQKTKTSDCSSQNGDSGVSGKHQSPMKEKNGVLNCDSEEKIDFSSVNPLDYPVYNQDFDVGDVVAFRILKMGSDYCPIVSGYVVGETVAKDSEPSIYSFKIISGEDQLKNPEGKFSLVTDEEMENSEETPNETEIHVLSREELLELRLIHRPGT